MKRLLLAAALLPTSAGAEPCLPDSNAPCAPSEAAKAPIMKAVRDGMSAREAMRAAIRERDAASDDPEIALLHWTAARTAQSEMKGSFDLAIRLAGQAYNVKSGVPREPRAAKPLSAEGAWSAGLPAPWAPEFGLPGHREIRGADGRLHYLSNDPQDAHNPEDVVAFTDPDGKVTIMPSLFDLIIRNDEPGLLASALHHEGEHHTDLITRGWDTHEQLEMRASVASLAMVDVFMPRLSAKARGAVKDGLRKLIVDAQASLDSGDTHSPFPSLKQEADFERKFRRQERRELEYHDLVRHVDRIRGNYRAHLDAARRNARWAKFNAWTLNSCVYIGGTSQNDPEWGRPDLIRAREQALHGYLRGNLVVIPRDEIDAGMERGDRVGSGDLARCQDRMIGMIRDLPAPINVDWLMDRIEYERRGGRTGEGISGVVEAVRRAVVDRAADLLSTATDPGTATRGSGEPVRDSAGGERESRLPSGDSYARDQLRGINARGRW